LCFRQSVSVCNLCPMDLLGDYGDDDESEHEDEAPMQTENASSGQTQGLSNLVGYLQAGDEDEGEMKEKPTSHSNRVATSTEPSPSPTLSSKGAVGSWVKDQNRDSTPTFKPRNAAIRIISKSNTPLANSPALPVDVPSDASCPASPHLPDSQRMPVGTSLSSLPDVTLPAAPEGEMDPKIAQNVAKFAHLRMHQNATVNAELYDKKEFHNPGILEFLVTTYDIKETGSNYPKELFDPESYAKLRPSIFYDHLRRQTESAETRRREDVKVPAARPLVQHVTVQSQQPARSSSAAAPAAAADGEKPRKRSKWDQATKAEAPPAVAGAASTGIAINDFQRLQQMGQ